MTNLQPLCVFLKLLHDTQALSRDHAALFRRFLCLGSAAGGSTFNSSGSDSSTLGNGREKQEAFGSQEGDLHIKVALIAEKR